MEDAAQARAYASADLRASHDSVVVHFRARFPDLDAGRVLDLACGPADVTVRLAHALPAATFVGVDGSRAMLDLARARIRAEGLEQRVHLEELRLPDPRLAALGRFDAVVCTSSLHHFHDPSVLWEATDATARPGAPVLVYDLLRPATPADARRIVDTYAAGEPEVLRRDHLASLRAAFTVEELREQTGGRFAVEVVSDRHVLVSGRRA